MKRGKDEEKETGEKLRGFLIFLCISIFIFFPQCSSNLDKKKRIFNEARCKNVAKEMNGGGINLI